MKTAISIPDPLGDSVEAFIKAAKISRSEFYQRAARHYLSRVSAKAVTANLDRIHGSKEHPGDTAFRHAAFNHLGELVGNEEW